MQGCQYELGAEGRLSPFCSSCPFLCPISLMPTLSLWRCHLFPVQVPARTPLQVIHVQVALTALNSHSAPLGVIQRGSPAPGRSSSPTMFLGQLWGGIQQHLQSPRVFSAKPRNNCRVCERTEGGRVTSPAPLGGLSSAPVALGGLGQLPEKGSVLIL